MRLLFHWAHGVVVSHPLRMRKALGSNPSVSIFNAHLCLPLAGICVERCAMGGVCAPDPRDRKKMRASDFSQSAKSPVDGKTIRAHFSQLSEERRSSEIWLGHAARAPQPHVTAFAPKACSPSCHLSSCLLFSTRELARTSGAQRSHSASALAVGSTKRISEAEMRHRQLPA